MIIKHYVRSRPGITTVGYERVTMVAPSRTLPIFENYSTHCESTVYQSECSKCEYERRLDGLRLYVRDRS